VPRILGTYTPKLDDKGRLTLPAKFREELAGGVMVTKGQRGSTPEVKPLQVEFLRTLHAVLLATF